MYDFFDMAAGEDTSVKQLEVCGVCDVGEPLASNTPAPPRVCNLD